VYLRHILNAVQLQAVVVVLSEWGGLDTFVLSLLLYQACMFLRLRPAHDTAAVRVGTARRCAMNSSCKARKQHVWLESMHVDMMLGRVCLIGTKSWAPWKRNWGVESEVLARVKSGH
jgi:hypothetical protein